MSRLFGIESSNRDFNDEKSWGKNQFNNAFPVALACYMESQDLNLVYFKLDGKLNFYKSYISTSELFGADVNKDKICYNFEDNYENYKSLSHGKLPGIDLVTRELKTKRPLKPIEIKLTTLPDHTTCNLADNCYGSEIVVRPDTIVYQAFSIVESIKGNTKEIEEIFKNTFNAVKDWHDAENVLANLDNIIDSLYQLVVRYNDEESPLLMQPVWKTKGKSAILAENCLDIFVWSNFSFMKLYVRPKNQRGDKIDRNNRTIVWLFLMIYDYIENKTINHKRIIDNYTYNTKNDKAFAIAGNRTNAIMKSVELEKPRVKKSEIKNIILDGGQNQLSPERRFDGVVQADTSLF